MEGSMPKGKYDLMSPAYGTHRRLHGKYNPANLVSI